MSENTDTEIVYIIGNQRELFVECVGHKPKEIEDNFFLKSIESGLPIKVNTRNVFKTRDAAIPSALQFYKETGLAGFGRLSPGGKWVKTIPLITAKLLKTDYKLYGHIFEFDDFEHLNYEMYVIDRIYKAKNEGGKWVSEQTQHVTCNEYFRRLNEKSIGLENSNTISVSSPRLR
jgi:hypothetical protein